jgi:anti-sigma regulatory factor (Ser/Thr protein kinase)
VVTSLPEARGFARTTLYGWGVVPDETVLVVHELASNAATHAHTPYSVVLIRYDGRVRVEVSDAHTAARATSVPTASGLHAGLGFTIVRNLATNWGMLIQDAGKTIWAEIAVYALPPPAGG